MHKWNIWLSAACKESISIKRLIYSMLRASPGDEGLLLFSDSKISIKLSENESINRRYKQIYITYHYIRYLVSWNRVSLRYCPNTIIIAYMLMKALVCVFIQIFVHMWVIWNEDWKFSNDKGELLEM